MWNALSTTDVTAEILPDEVNALNAVQGSTGVLAGILANVIAEVSFSTALTTLHEKAIYLHEARQYQVERVSYEVPMDNVCKYSVLVVAQHH